jgi:hypothetical protein
MRRNLCTFCEPGLWPLSPDRPVLRDLPAGPFPTLLRFGPLRLAQPVFVLNPVVPASLGR